MNIKIKFNLHVSTPLIFYLEREGGRERERDKDVGIVKVVNSLVSKSGFRDSHGATPVT